MAIRDSIKTLVTNNWGLKLTAFILASMSFIAIRNVTNDEATYTVPIEVDVDKGIAILDMDPPSIKVTFRGSLDDLRRLDLTQVKAVVKPTASDPAGSEWVSIEKNNIKGVIGVRPVMLVPGTVNLTFDWEDEQQFPVSAPAIDGKPLQGRVELDYEPKFVTLRGPRRQLQRMLEQNRPLDTEAVDVSERVKSFTRIVQVISPSETWVSQIEPSEIKVSVNIVTETISRNWTNMTVLAIMDRDHVHQVEIEPATVDVALSGRTDAIRGIKNDVLKVFVDCVGLDPTKKHNLPVNVHLPTGTAATVTVLPARVDVFFREAGEKNDVENSTMGNNN